MSSTKPQDYEVRPDVHNLTTSDNGSVRNVQQDVDYEPHPEKSISISREHREVVDAITRLYSGSASEADMQVYDEKAVYDDPWSYCNTRYKIAGQWYGELKWRRPEDDCLGMEPKTDFATLSRHSYDHGHYQDPRDRDREG